MDSTWLQEKKKRNKKKTFTNISLLQTYWCRSTEEIISHKNYNLKNKFDSRNLKRHRGFCLFPTRTLSSGCALYGALQSSFAVTCRSTKVRLWETLKLIVSPLLCFDVSLQLNLTLTITNTTKLTTHKKTPKNPKKTFDNQVLFCSPRRQITYVVCNWE